MLQVQQLQAQMEKAQEELANETVEASAGGGMVTVKATGALQITEIKISPEAIDPDDPEMLADMVLAAVKRSASPRSVPGAVEARRHGRARRPRRPGPAGHVAPYSPMNDCFHSRRICSRSPRSR